MRNMNLRKVNKWIAQIMAIVMVLASVMLAPVSAAQTVANPSLSKTTLSINVGKQDTLVVNNKVEKSTYEWYSENTDIAAVDENGVVEGIAIGTTTVSCEITMANQVIKLNCKVTVSRVLDNNTFENVDSSEVTALMGAGWNLGNQLEAIIDSKPGETNWGNPVITQKLIDSVKAAGFSTIRIPVSYFNYIGAAPDYKIDTAWLDRIKQVVDYCIKDNLFVIINMHGDGYDTIPGSWLLCGEKDQAAIKAKYEAVWSQIATKFNSYDEHLIFESMNEEGVSGVNKPTPELYKNINDYNQIFVDTVRQAGGYNDMRWVLIPGWNTNIDLTVGDYGFKIPGDVYLSTEVPLGENRIMISAHYYSPWDFCGGENKEKSQWGESAADLSRISTYGGESFMAAQFQALRDAFTGQGYPVVIGEYGTIDKSSFDPKSTFYRAYFARKICENSIKFGCIPVIWDNGYNEKYGFGLFNRKDAKVTQPEIIAAIMNVYYPKPIIATAGSIKLNKTEIDAVVAGNPVALKATLIGPKKGTVKWSSDDESIATVSDTGVVRAYQEGTVSVTASANGRKAECIVNCKETENVLISLYALETKSWGAVKSPTNVEVAKEGGTYTLSLSGSKDALSYIGALYLKDIQVESGMKKNSNFSSAMIKVNSVKFNGVNCTVTQASPEQAINKDSHAFDFGILNQWSKEVKIKEAELGETGSYKFTGAYKDLNTIEVSFTVSDTSVAIATPTPVPTATPVPAKYVVTPIYKVKYDFNITGVNTASTVFNISGTGTKADFKQTIALNGDGDYSATFDLADLSGIINLGYFKTDDASTAVVTLKSITVNGYVLNNVDAAYPKADSKAMKVNTSFENGLRNIWNTTDPITAAYNDDALLTFTDTPEKAFVFKVKEGAAVPSTPAPTVTPAPTPEPTPAPTPAGPKSTAITKLKYDFNITGGAANEILTFTATDTNWKNYENTIELKGDGDYSVEFGLDNITTLVNLGFFKTDEKSNAVATLKKITVNGTYEMPYEATLKVNSGNDNGLKNIWNSKPNGLKIARSADAYIAFIKGDDSDTIQFFLTQPTVTAITKLKYDFNITGAAANEILTFTATDSNWKDYKNNIELKGDGDYSVEFDLDNITSLCNLGYFKTDENSSAVATLKKITVNGTYEMTYEAALKVNSGNDNGLKNIWNSKPDGLKIAESDEAYIAFIKGDDSDSLKFFLTQPTLAPAPIATPVPTETPAPTATPAPVGPASTAMTKLKYDFHITGGAANEKLTFIATDTNWKDYKNTIELKGDGDYSVEFDLDNITALCNLGYFSTDPNSSAVATLKIITVNGTYEMTYEAALLINSGNDNGLKNIWNAKVDGLRIAESGEAYIAFIKGDSDAIKFFLKEPAVAAITKLKYDFNITGGVASETLTFTATDSNWKDYKKTIELKGDGDYSVEFDLDNITSLCNLGYFSTDPNSSAVATLKKITVNGTYEMTYEAALKINSGTDNGLKNIWNAKTDGLKIAESAKAYIAFIKGDSDAIKFFVK